MNTPGPLVLYCHNVSWRYSSGDCGATSPEISAAHTSPPCTSGRSSQSVSYQGFCRAAASRPTRARNRCGCSSARCSAIRPPIEQPMKTGLSRSNASARARIVSMNRSDEQRVIAILPTRRRCGFAVPGKVGGDHAETARDGPVVQQVPPLAAHRPRPYGRRPAECPPRPPRNTAGAPRRRWPDADSGR